MTYAFARPDSRRLALCLGFNFLLSLLLGTSYVFFSGNNPLELFFVCVALVSNTVMLYAALSLPSLLLSFLPAGRWLAGCLLGFFQLALITDISVYKIFKFHLNSMVLNLLLTPGGLDSLEQGWGMKVFFAAIAALLFVLQWLFWRWSGPLTARAAGRGRLFKRAGALLLLCVVADKGMFAWGTLYDCGYIARNDHLFPLYQPLKVRSFANKYLGVKLDDEVKGGILPGYSGLTYPRVPLKVVPPVRPLNFLIIITDSLRADMLTPDIMPETWALAGKAAVFKNHYSGGNCTRFGIFSIFYGLDGNYWFSMLGERRGPVFIDTLKAQGYDLRLFAASKLSFPEFNKTCFVKVPRGGIYDEPSGDHAGRDRDIADKFIGYLKTRDPKKPYFSFIFYDASHGSYDYPSGFEKFKPAEAVSPLILNKDNYKPLFNRYKNSVRYDDYLTGQVLKAVRDTGGLKDTVVVLSGDHGEPFFESGYYGHNQGYCPSEVRVPLVLYAPGRGHSLQQKITSHRDVAPTLLRLAGVANPPLDYASGDDLFSGAARKYVSVFSWDTAAIIKDGETLVMPLEAYRGGVKVYDKAYREMDKKAAGPFAPLIMQFQKEAVSFSR